MRPYYQRISYRVLKLFLDTVRVRLPNRSILVPCRELSSLGSLFWTPSWKTDLLARIFSCREGAVLDIGANVGQTLFDFLVAAPDRAYWGFEPNVRCVTYLNRIIEMNGLINAKVIPAALGLAPALVELHRLAGSDTDSAAFINRFTRPNWNLKSDYIACLRFDDISPVLKLDRIAICKIDVEGFELEVLSGMREMLRERRPPVLCEVLDADENADFGIHVKRIEQLESLLRDVDYRIFRVVKSDAVHFDRIEIIEEFSRKRWTKQREDDCDYVFMHRADPLAETLRSA
jgi:FkbM family methyltransferase